ncbi:MULTISPECIES: YaaL family protein [Exiguobacterium]|uniref:YaaL family protein n=1 Tax=Exiguobacterium TaxID=33986 RepID=UPI001BA4773E|nr:MULTISPECIES: YaaL family protein [Exiguobacterium]MCT4784479.1 YaaL family protein [Exiguobacterium himgiriensis]QUE86702.1 YaaL family protein [Exiguobacterium alkaliphilum]
MRWFRKSLRTEYDQRFLEELLDAKSKFEAKRYMLDVSIEDTGELAAQVKQAEMLYFFYLKEAKRRNVSLSSLRS